MIQAEKAQVWARKDELIRALTQIPATDKKMREQVNEQIEACNQALVQNKFELMPQADAEQK